MAAAAYGYSVFVNCPLDEAYRNLFETIVFAIHDCGYIARCAGGTAIVRRYELFRAELPAMCERLQLRVEELTFNNYVVQVEEWLKLNSQVTG